MNIVFLDVDGELTYSDYDNEETANIDIEKVKLLKEICDKTNAKVVISSSWRGSDTYTPRIYLGRCEYVPLPTSVDSERILFDLDEEYCSETGCENYIYEDVTDEQTKWLEDKLSDLMLEFYKMIGLKPCWFTVVEQEEIDLYEYQKEKLDECK